MAPRKEDETATGAGVQNEEATSLNEAIGAVPEESTELDVPAGHVAVRINPALWRWDRIEIAEGIAFTHEPSVITEAQYEELSERKVQVGESERQLIVKA